MRHRIRKGHHSAARLPQLFLYRNNFVRYVAFSDSCRYDLDSPDQYDYSKVFGAAFGGHHHQNSARFGWRYNETTSVIELAAYCYVDGIRIIEPITQVAIDDEIRLEIEVYPTGYNFWVNDTALLRIRHNGVKSFGYELGPYWGGNTKAPRDIYIYISKISMLQYY